MNAGHPETWKQVIMEHSQFPRGARELADATHEGRGENPFCGDRVRVQLIVGADGVIVEAACVASGCAISLASASLLAGSVQGLRADEARARFEQVRAMLVESRSGGYEQLGELQALQLVRQYPSRVKCATLAWHGLRNALDRAETTAVTES